MGQARNQDSRFLSSAHPRERPLTHTFELSLRFIILQEHSSPLLEGASWAACG